MAYAIGARDRWEREEAWRVYMAESVRALAQGKYVAASYADIVSRERVAQRDADEVVGELVGKGAFTVEPT